MRRCVASLVLGVLLAGLLRAEPARPTIAFAFPLPGTGMYPAAIAVDPFGNTYIAATSGETSTIAFPISDNAAQKTKASMIIAKIDSSGQHVLWATYLGGSHNRNWYWRGALDRATAIAVDAENNVIVAGLTAATDFPAVNAAIATPQPTGTDGFLTKISADGSRFAYSTYLGRANPMALAADAIGNAYLGVSSTAALDYETTDLSGALGPGSLAVTKFNPSGRPLFATRFGSYASGGTGTIAAVALDDAGAIVVTGSASGDFPLVNAAFSDCVVAPSSGICYAPFVVKLNPTGTAFTYATRLGGRTGSTVTTSIAIGPDGSAWVGGYTTASDYPLKNPILSTPFPGGTFVLTRLGPTGRLVTSTYVASTAPGTYSLPKVFVDFAGEPILVAADASSGTSPLGMTHPDAPVLVSTDSGASWVPSATGLPGSVAALAATGSGPETWYAGAADGIYVSRDAMQSWHRSSAGLAGDQVVAIAVDDEHPGTAYAGTASGTYKTVDSAATWRLVDSQRYYLGPAGAGLVVDGNGWVLVGTEGIRRSRDGGQMCEDLSNGFRIYTTGVAPHYGPIAPIVFDPNTAGTIYAVQSNALFRTRDGGQSWSPVDSLSRWTVSTVALPAGQPRRIYAAVSNELERSDDDGATWQPLGLRAGVRQILIAPGQPDIVYAFQPYGGPMLYGSTDAGQHWTTIAGGGGALPSIASQLAIDPRRPGRLAATATVRTLPFVIGFNLTATAVNYDAFVNPPGASLSAPIVAAADPSGAVYLVESGSSNPLLVKVAPPQILNPSRNGSS